MNCLLSGFRRTGPSCILMQLSPSFCSTRGSYFSFTPRYEAMRIMSSGEALFLRWSSTLLRILMVSHSGRIWIPQISIEPFSTIETARSLLACSMSSLLGIPLTREYVPSVHVIVCLVRRRYEMTVFIASFGNENFIFLPADQSNAPPLLVKKG